MTVDWNASVVAPLSCSFGIRRADAFLCPLLLIFLGYVRDSMSERSQSRTRYSHGIYSASQPKSVLDCLVFSRPLRY